LIKNKGGVDRWLETQDWRGQGGGVPGHKEQGTTEGARWYMMVLAQARNDKDTLQEGMFMLLESCGKKQGLCWLDGGANDGEGLRSQGDPRRDRSRVIS
jgi:hypothetical protein